MKKLLSEKPFSEKSQKSYIGRISENPGIRPGYDFCEFP